MLNPELHPFCLGGDRKTVSIPIFFNATIPVEVELIRTDFETNQQESIKLTRVQIRDIERRAKRESQEGVQTIQFDYAAKKAGAYQLGRVLDEYKLEVQRKNPQTFVVACPKAWVGPSPSVGRCINDLSDLSLQVEGTPPLKIKYSRTINGKDHSFHFQSLQPEGFSSPLTALRSTSLIGLEDEDISWARSQRVPVGLNESMHTSGDWQYSIDEVQDGFGNVVKYENPADDPEGKPKPKHLVQNFVVKDRPQVRLRGCDPRNPLKGAKGRSKALPVQFQYPPGKAPDNTAYTLSWQFSPIDTLTESGDHGDVVSTGTYNARNAKDQPSISAPGLYTLKSVSAGSCEGEVQEPSSCLLLNPPEPKLTLRSEEIPDTCAGNSIGLLVDMDLIGTPPFIVNYDMITNGERERKRVNIPGLRFQMDLVPLVAGHHQYIFTHITDALYKDQKLSGPEFVLEQDVKPAAAALLQHSTGKMNLCLGQEATVDILLLGDPPFTLEWEVIHDGKRRQHKATGIQENGYQIKTSPLTQGGEYTLGLTSVQDKRGCRNFLQDELKVSVRRQNPRAAFGQIKGKRKVMGVEGSVVQLPVRLTGERPWTVFYMNSNEGTPENPRILSKTVDSDNGFLEVRARGTYTIMDVKDRQCDGVVDPKASKFEVDWVPRPELSVALSHGVSQADSGYVVEDVCEGDVSGFEVALKGRSISEL